MSLNNFQLSLVEAEEINKILPFPYRLEPESNIPSESIKNMNKLNSKSKSSSKISTHLNKKKHRNENSEKSNTFDDNDYYDNDNLINKINSENTNIISEFNKKYDEESNYIEIEFNFYDFDEQLLQYRSLEIEQLMKSLLDLKSSMILTSKDREVKYIIEYSYSDKIFRKFNNKEGSIICQSNIGYMESQLSKFDKAIYHLALSLQDNKLKKYLDQNITDEFDENDSLLNKISNF